MEGPPTRRGFSFGFGLSGLLAAAMAYFAFDAGLFAGPRWRGVLVACAIGILSALLLLAAERGLGGGRTGRRAKMKGDWGCPECGAAYVPEATECSDCRVPLVRREG